MSEALDEAGIADGATVTDVEFAGYIGTGQMSRNGRFRLTWDQPEGRPASVVGKFPSDDESTRVAAFQSGTYLGEYSFYAEIAKTVDVCTPHCWVARIDEEQQSFVLIMEDMASSVQGDQFTGSTLDEVALALEQAAGLHAPRWGDPSAGQPAGVAAGRRGPRRDGDELLRGHVPAVPRPTRWQILSRRSPD